MGKSLNPVSMVGGLVGSTFDVLGDPTGKKYIDAGLAGQAATTAQANAMLKKTYDDQLAETSPWRDAGLSALGDMQGADFKRDFTANDFQADPGYAFRMAEGQKALERSAAAKGGLQTGGTLKELAQYGQNLASQEYGNAYNRFNADRDRRFGRLSQLAGMGQHASDQRMGAMQNYGNQYSANTTGFGNAQAGAAVAKANGNQAMMSGLMSLGSKAASGGAK